MSIINCFAGSLQAATPENHFEIESTENLTDHMFNTIPTNLKSCNSYNLQNLNLTPKCKTTHFLFHLNISSLQAHFDELNESSSTITLFSVHNLFIGNPH